MGIETKSQKRKDRRRQLVRHRRGLRDVLTASETMDPDVKEDWVKALRSGKYKQGKATMCDVGEDGSESFCCLGVLANEAIDADWHLDEGCCRLGRQRLVDGLSKTQLKSVGLSSASQAALAKANDIGLRFSTIADAIEECL